MSNTSTTPATPDGADPSMEDILASIRRILNEDEAPAAAVEKADDAATSADVLVLDASMMVSVAEPAVHQAEIRPETMPVPDFEPEPQPQAAAPQTVPAQPKMETMTSPNQVDVADEVAPAVHLLAPETAAAAASSVDSLVRTLTAGRATHVFTGGPTLEDLVRAELRPMLKEWLDANLPPVVERMVRIEIEKVVGRTDF